MFKEPNGQPIRQPNDKPDLHPFLQPNDSQAKQQPVKIPDTSSDAEAYSAYRVPTRLRKLTLGELAWLSLIIAN